MACALSPLGDIHQTVGNLNNHFGVPMTLVAAPEGASASVVEMGTSGPSEIALLSSIGRPDIRLIVTIGASHLEELGGLAGVAQEKGALFRDARPGDICCVNLDDPYIRAMIVPSHASVITYGAAEDARVRMLEARIDPVSLSTQVAFEIDGKTYFCELPTPGVHIAHNAAGALAVALAAGVDPGQACEAMTAYEPVGMRMAIESLPKGVTAFNDAYNANPTSMEASLRMFASLPGRKVAVLGDMLELGEDEARYHDEIAELAVRLRLDRVLLVGPRMSLALQGVDAGRVERAVDGTLLAGPLADWLGAGDRVLFKGSRGAKVERILHALSQALASSSEVS
jgi:UDP-N-acetylmuramoyl-tripeptide--D-alanyl-D-alanine ligase